MTKGIKKYFNFLVLILLFICGTFIFVCQAQGLEQRYLGKGDIIRLNVIPRPEWDIEFEAHVVMYIGIENCRHRFIEAGPFNVHRCGPPWIRTAYDGFKYYYVLNNYGQEPSPSEKDQVINFAKSKLLKFYQNYSYSISHCDFSDNLDHNGAYFTKYKDWSYWQRIYHRYKIYLRCLRQIYCTELVWMSYKNELGIDISYETETWDQTCYDLYNDSYSGLGDDCYNWISFNSMELTTGDGDNTIEYEAINSPLSPIFIEGTVAGTVDGSLPDNDPINNTWNTIQQGIDNLKTNNVLYVKNGNYTENITVDKSIIIIGENKSKIILNGSIEIIDELDYELPNYGKDSIIVDVNMTGNQLLYHFNNDSEIGENYSSSDIIFDYSGQANNGTKNGVNWNTSTIKGNGSFDFNGINDSINLSSITVLNRENITVSSWIYWKNGTGLINPIISQSNATHGYCLYINNTTNKPVFQLDDTEVISSSNITYGWHHIVGTHNDTLLKIYVDGKLKGSASKTGSGSNLDCYIGYDNNSDYFKGSIDEVAVWNKTFSDDEIKDMYCANYGASISNFTLQNGDIGLILGNRSEVCSVVLSNFTSGIQMKNISEAWIVDFNITDCNTAMIVNDSIPENNESILIGFGEINNCTKGITVNSSANTFIGFINFNCSNSSLKFNDCDINKMYVSNCSISSNIAPDKPENISGVDNGFINYTYSYSSKTNDSDNDPIYYQIYWGDGNISDWLGPYNSNETLNFNYSWAEEGGYPVFIQAMDVFFNKSEYSDILIFRTEVYPPLVSNVSGTPDTVGFGGNITISADVVDNSQNYSGVQCVFINITYPNSSTINVSMTDIGNDTYQYNFTDAWTVGQYNYTIWALDNAYNTNSSTGYSFNISAQATMSISTIKEQYGDNQTINLTDPPGQSSSSTIGYKLIDNNEVLHIWNRYDNYYFNISNGVQFTNHKDNYWTHNVLMLGYYNNNVWNLIYRTDNLSGFNKNIISDNETYVNASLWKDLTYQGYDFRLAIRYYLGVDDNELTVIPYIKNIDDEDIPYNLGFAWELKDIQVDMTATDDYIEINGTTYYLNQTLNETYTNLSDPCYYIKENKTNNKFESLYLRWDENLDYKVKIKSKAGQYNAPVTLGIKIGTLNVGQEKFTSLFWHDASEIVYYFNGYNIMGEIWTITPGYMVNGNENQYARTKIDGDIELCTSNSCPGTYLGDISKVELRCKGYYSMGMMNPASGDIWLRPVMGSNDGSNHLFDCPYNSGDWSTWFDITDDPNMPDEWLWDARGIEGLRCDVEATDLDFDVTVYCSKVEIRVTYTPHNISDPYPSDGCLGVSLIPMLNITVSDPEGDLMNISWYTNISGKWSIFGTNNSVSNGTYHQTFNNVTVNGQWWYWKVNVTDVNGSFTESDVFKFYSGYQSKIENTGSTNIKGYLTINVQYYNTTTENWTLANDTVNETTMRTIYIYGTGSDYVFGLDTIFNNQVNTTSLLDSFGSGTYRVYAAFRDPDGDVLVCDNESLMEATYNFTITSS